MTCTKLIWKLNRTNTKSPTVPRSPLGHLSHNPAPQTQTKPFIWYQVPHSTDSGCSCHLATMREEFSKTWNTQWCFPIPYKLPGKTSVMKVTWDTSTTCTCTNYRIKTLKRPFSVAGCLMYTPPCILLCSFMKKNPTHIVNILVNVITDAPNINTVINDPLMLHSCILYAVTPLVHLNGLFLPLWRIKFDNIFWWRKKSFSN